MSYYLPSQGHTFRKTKKACASPLRLPSSVFELKNKIAKLLPPSKADLIDSHSAIPQPLLARCQAASPVLDSTVAVLSQAFKAGVEPSLTVDGTGGTYLLKDQRRTPLAVFKPLDEEAFAPSNPRHYTATLGSASLRPGVRSGEAGYREAAAYLLDYEHFSGVPATTLVQSRHSAYVNGCHLKKGSLQRYVPSQGCAEDFAFTKFSTEQVQRIGILDLRILNMDRNVTNLLVTTTFELVPIDHGLSLPEQLCLHREDVCWMDWPQAKQPFSQDALAFIAQLQPRKDAERLTGLLSDAALKLLRAAGVLLKVAAARGLTMYEIGCMLYRAAEGVPSAVEKVIEHAERLNQVPEPSCKQSTYSTSSDIDTTTEETSISFEELDVDCQPSSAAFDDEFFQLLESLLEAAVSSWKAVPSQ